MRRIRGLLYLSTVVAFQAAAAVVFRARTEVESWRVGWSGGVAQGVAWRGVGRGSRAERRLWSDWIPAR